MHPYVDWLAIALTATVMSGCAVMEDSLFGEPFSAAPPEESSVAPDAGSTSVTAASDAATVSNVDAGRCASTRGPTMVAVGADCIDTTEVTNEQYAAFLTATKTAPVAAAPRCGSNESLVPADGWPYPSSRGNHPVRYVDWCDAYAYCAWAGKSLCGRVGGGSLATSEAKDPQKSVWYRACTLSGSRPLPYGEKYVADACNVTRDGDDDDLAVRASPACEGGVNGVFDMVGNVSEWIDACETNDQGMDSCISQGGAHQSGASADCGWAYAKPRSSVYSGRGFRCCK